MRVAKIVPVAIVLAAWCRPAGAGRERAEAGMVLPPATAGELERVMEKIRFPSGSGLEFGDARIGPYTIEIEVLGPSGDIAGHIFMGPAAPGFTPVPGRCFSRSVAARPEISGLLEDVAARMDSSFSTCPWRPSSPDTWGKRQPDNSAGVFPRVTKMRWLPVALGLAVLAVMALSAAMLVAIFLPKDFVRF